MRLLVATTNPDKLREIRGVLTGGSFGPALRTDGLPTVKLLSLTDLPPVPEPEETGATFEANAEIKALYYDALARRSGVSGSAATDLTVAEDSGLEIDALGGDPGVLSARFVSPDASYAERFAEIYRRLNHMQAPRPWTARFVCAISVVADGTPVFQTRGTVEGRIAEAPAGGAGFGYDPIFFYPDFGCTLAEVSAERKLMVAHRGHAFRALDRWLSEHHPY
ncbi:MAG: non-canonical purine NTP pyrophosphatase [Vicinamibacterales bacterium]